MRMALIVHILGGGLGLVSGTVALYATKGATVHRKSGMLFVYAMLTMAVSGAAIAAFTGVETSVIGGLLTAYLVITALTTVRPPDPRLRWVDIGAVMLAFGVGLSSVALAIRWPGWEYSPRSCSLWAFPDSWRVSSADR